MESIRFETEDGEVEFFVLEQTMLAGRNYILVTDSPDREEGSFLILKDMSENEDEFASYEEIMDENELESVVKIFNELVDDINLEV
jgi:hypothetical protein